MPRTSPSPLHHPPAANSDLNSAASSMLLMVDEVEQNENDPDINCDDIVTKLMNYSGGSFKPTVIHQETDALLEILPMQWSDALSDIGLEKVSDISLDLARRPYCWHNHCRQYLCEDVNEVVQGRDLEGITESLQGFGDDNRAGIDGQLHRISCIRNNRNGVIGLTIRVGRHIEGNSDMIRDLLEESTKSILLLGEVSTFDSAHLIQIISISHHSYTSI